VKALLAAGADVNAKGVPFDRNPAAANSGYLVAPLAGAARVGFGARKLLLENKADVNVHDDLFFGYTPLRWAVEAPMLKW